MFDYISLSIQGLEFLFFFPPQVLGLDKETRVDDLSLVSFIEVGLVFWWVSMCFLYVLPLPFFGGLRGSLVYFLYIFGSMQGRFVMNSLLVQFVECNSCVEESSPLQVLGGSFQSEVGLSKEELDELDKVRCLDLPTEFGLALVVVTWSQMGLARSNGLGDRGYGGFGLQLLLFLFFFSFYCLQDSVRMWPFFQMDMRTFSIYSEKCQEKALKELLGTLKGYLDLTRD